MSMCGPEGLCVRVGKGSRSDDVLVGDQRVRVREQDRDVQEFHTGFNSNILHTHVRDAHSYEGERNTTARWRQNVCMRECDCVGYIRV